MSCFPCWKPESPKQKEKKHCRQSVGSLLWSLSCKEWSGWSFSINHLEKFPRGSLSSSGWISTTCTPASQKMQDCASNTGGCFSFLRQIPEGTIRVMLHLTPAHKQGIAVEPGGSPWHGVQMITREMYAHGWNLSQKRHKVGSYQPHQSRTTWPGLVSAWGAPRQSCHWKPLHVFSLAGI